MRTKENYMNKQFDVTYDKLFHTSDGMGFVLKREEDIDSRMMEVFGTDIHIQIATIGCVVLFTNLLRTEKLSWIPYVSNAPLLDEVYKMIENGECK